MDMINITAVVVTLIAFVAAIVGATVIPWINAKMGAEELAMFLRWVEIGVAAAEQLYAATDGEKKKCYVVNFLEKKGYTVNFEDIENAIEAAVLKLHSELYVGSESDA